MNIVQITADLAQKIVRAYRRGIGSDDSYRGLFYYKGKRQFVAIDNTTGDCWVEEFRSKRRAINWLRRA